VSFSYSVIANTETKLEGTGSENHFGSHYVAVRSEEEREETKGKRAAPHQGQAALFKK
jgi:hypothetical protein